MGAVGVAANMEDRIGRLSLNDEEGEELVIQGRRTVPEGLELCLGGVRNFNF